MAWQASELILNPDGSVYHLNLKPDQLARTVITVGDQDRVGQVSRYFDRIEHKVRHREFVTHTGWLGKVRLSVVSTGIGPDNIDIVMNELDVLANIDLSTREPFSRPVSLNIIRLGTCGALHHDTPVDSLVVSSGAVGFDGLMQFYDAPEQHCNPLLDALYKHAAPAWTFPVAPYYAEGDAGLQARLAPGWMAGITATNPGFYAPQGRQLRAPARHPDYLGMLRGFAFEGRTFLNLEMETAAIYGLAGLLGHRALSCSVILANRYDGAFSKQPKKAVKKLIESVLSRVADIREE
jgi:uridine phosphorylase